MDRDKEITRHLRKHDLKLYCERREGKLCVMRESTKVESYDVDGTTIHFVVSTPFFIMALTRDWKLKSPPVDWGMLPIMRRIKEIDLWNRDLAEESIRQTEKDTERSQRHLSNETEAFVKDFRGAFKRATNDVNTSTLSKKDKRKTEEKKYGNR